MEIVMKKLVGQSDSAARRAAARVQLKAIKSRCRRGTYKNYGEFMLIDPFTRIPVAGFSYDLTAQEVIEFCEG